MNPGDTPDYDVCLSFASEDRSYVEAVAEELRSRTVKVFYDKFEQVTLWGKQLYTHLDEIYRFRARYCVIFVSQHYVTKLWPSHERASAQARSFEAPSEYILPARFDDSHLPGLLPTVGYLDLTEIPPDQLAELICQKLDHYTVPASRVDFGWANSETAEVGTCLRRYQNLPVVGVENSLTSFGQSAVRAILSCAVSEGDEYYWRHGENRPFDHLYATSSVGYAFCHLGFAPSWTTVKGLTRHIQGFEAGDLNNRASAIYRIVTGTADDSAATAFVAALASAQISDKASPNHGSFDLIQGPVGRNESKPSYWDDRPRHWGGAAFHACHIIDSLLHLDSNCHRARAMAVPVMDEIRHYLARTLAQNNGWLLDRRGFPTAMTLYVYWLLPALRVPLPPQWRAVVGECVEVLSGAEVNPLAAHFGIINLMLLNQVTGDSGLRAESRPFVASFLESSLSSTDFASRDSVELAASIRAVLYAVDFLAEGQSLQVVSGAHRALAEFEAEMS